MRPKSLPSASTTAQPRPLTGSPSSKPAQVNVTPGLPAFAVKWPSSVPVTAMKAI